MEELLRVHCLTSSLLQIAIFLTRGCKPAFYISFSYLILLRRRDSGTGFQSEQCFSQQWAGAPYFISTNLRPGQPCLAREAAVRAELSHQETLWKEGEIST